MKPNSQPSDSPFLFATGIENSSPTIIDPAGRIVRIDEMQKTRHYERWADDFLLVKELGIKYLRYGIPLYKVHIGPGHFDWSFSDVAFDRLQFLGITPIVDLCHFGVPDWVGDFQNPEFPFHFANYAWEFAKRFPWIKYYTPINEIYIAAHFSAKLGFWNERLKSDIGFVTALKNLVKAQLLAEMRILEVKPDAIFIQSESSEYFHAHSEASENQAFFHNQLRFVSFDLSYGNDVKASVYQYLLDNGMTREEYLWFSKYGQSLKKYCVMGNDYYASNEHLIYPDGSIAPSGEILGYYVITKQYFDRYHLPIMHTETNARDESMNALTWLQKEWSSMLRLKNDGVPIIGFTWYSLIDQVDWDSSLTKNIGTVNPLGLFDINRKIRPVGEMYRKLLKQWQNLSPLESICLHHQHSSNESLHQ